jgi:hypothetical protein
LRFCSCFFFPFPKAPSSIICAENSTPILICSSVYHIFSYNPEAFSSNDVQCHYYLFIVFFIVVSIECEPIFPHHNGPLIVFQDFIELLTIIIDDNSAKMVEGAKFSCEFKVKM